jgi:hypothetical protein
MELTSIMCRTQEAAQRARAANASLENVRIVAERAALAWAHEAGEAERREARRARARAVAEVASVKKQRSEDDDQMFSENPDRGLSHN